MRGVQVGAYLQGEQAVLVKDGIKLGLFLPPSVENEVGCNRQTKVVGLGEQPVGVPAFEIATVPGGVGGPHGLPAVDNNLSGDVGASVGDERYRIFVRPPLGVEGEVRLDDRLKVVSLADALVREPTDKGEPVPHRIGGPHGTPAVGDDLGGNIGASVGDERHRVLVCLPPGVKGQIGLHGGFEVVGLGASGVGAPAGEGKTVPGGVGGLRGLSAVSNDLHADIGAAIGDERHRALVHLPLGVEGEVGLHGEVEVVGLGEGLVGVPALESVAGLGGVGGLGGLGAGGDGLGLYGRAPVGVEGHGVGGLLLPLGVEGKVRLHGRAEVVGLGAGGIGVPTRELAVV